MANIKQQKKRVGIAARQRLQNLRYKSAVKTLQRSLRDAVNLADKDLAASRHKELVRLLDRAGARRALHPNTVARRKALASRILISEPVKEAKTIRRARKKAPAMRKPKATKAETTAAVSEETTTEATATATATKAPAKPKAKATETAAKPKAAKAPAKAPAKAKAAEAAPAEDAPVEVAAAEAAPEASEEA